MELFNDNIRKEKIASKNTELFYNLVDSSKESGEQQQFQKK